MPGQHDEVSRRRDEVLRRAAQLAEDAAKARLRSRDLAARVLAAAAGVAVTEDQVADTLERLARNRPRDAARLLTMSTAARRYAAHERQWVADHAAAAGHAGGQPPDVPAGQHQPVCTEGNPGPLRTKIPLL